MPVLVKNNTPGPAVYSDPEHNVLIEFGGANDPEGRDYQEIPEDIVRKPSFARAIRRGIYSIVDANEEEMERILAPQYAAADAAIAEREQAIQGVLDASNVENDLIEAKCLISGETIFVRAGDLKIKPPLAERFADRANEFERVEVPGALDAKGQPAVLWVRKDSAAAPTAD